MLSFAKTKYEKAAWLLLFLGVIILICTAIVFITHKLYPASQPIKGETLGQFGEVIGGIIGTIISLVSFLLLYENLNEQRIQAKTQTEDSLFYRFIEKQQSRTINSIVTYNGTEYKGFHILRLINECAIKKLEIECIDLAREVMSKSPELLRENSAFNLINIQYNGLPLENIWEITREFLHRLNEKTPNERWEYLKFEFGSLGNEGPETRKVFRQIGSLAFYDINFFDDGERYPRQEVYKKTFDFLNKEFGYFLDGYFRDMDFITSLIEKSTNANIYLKCFVSQISRYDIVLVFYYLLSGRASIEFAKFIIKYNLLKDLYSYNYMLVDSAYPQQIDGEILNIIAIYEL